MNKKVTTMTLAQLRRKVIDHTSMLESRISTDNTIEAQRTDPRTVKRLVTFTVSFQVLWNGRETPLLKLYWWLVKAGSTILACLTTIVLY